MRCRHYKRKPGESRLLWKEHLKRGMTTARARKKLSRGVGRMIKAMSKLGISFQEASSAFRSFSDAWLRGGNFFTDAKAGLAMIETPKSTRERKDI